MCIFVFLLWDLGLPLWSLGRRSANCTRCPDMSVTGSQVRAPGLHRSSLCCFKSNSQLPSRGLVGWGGFTASRWPRRRPCCAWESFDTAHRRRASVDDFPSAPCASLSWLCASTTVKQPARSNSHLPLCSKKPCERSRLAGTGEALSLPPY